MAQAFDAMMAWAESGVKPPGDDVVTLSVVANSDYGCNFTDNSIGPDDSPELRAERGAACVPG